MNVSNRQWVDEGGCVLQWYASGVSDGTRIQRNWLTWIVHGHVMLYMGRRGEAGWEKTWSEKHPAVTFGTPCPLMSVIRTSIIWLPLFHRSLVISLHVGTSSVVLSPRGCSDYGWLDSCVGSWYIHPDAHTDKQILKIIGQVRHSNILCPSPQLHSSRLHRWKIDAVSHFPQLQSCFIQIWQIEILIHLYCCGPATQKNPNYRNWFLHRLILPEKGCCPKICSLQRRRAGDDSNNLSEK